MADDATDIIQGFWADFYGTASYVSMAALAIYDHCITFDREVQHIWSRRFNLSSAIFIVNRYLNLLGILALTSIQLFSRTPSSGRRHSCLGLWYFVSIALIFQDIADLSFFVLSTRWTTLKPNMGVSTLFSHRMQNFVFHSSYPLMIFRIRYTNTSAALSMVFSILVLLGTLGKTLTLKMAAKRIGMKGNLLSLLIRDGTTYLCVNVILKSLEAILFNFKTAKLGSSANILIGPMTWFSPIIISRMILDLKSIHQVSTSGSLSDLQSSQISSIRFIGSIGAPLNDTTVMTENEDEDEATNPDTATTRLVSIKQIIEDPLSIGLFDEKYNSATERGSAAVSTCLTETQVRVPSESAKTSSPSIPPINAVNPSFTVTVFCFISNASYLSMAAVAVYDYCMTG
ncbi:hypothetical protein ABKN59_007964 [Abortiporus biennis]